MLCPSSRLMDDQAFLALFNRRTVEGSVPFNGGMDLMSSCNLSCRHCYIRNDGDGFAGVIDAGMACRVLDEAAAAGCLFFLITGGEPMLHPEFYRIYSHAKEIGLFVTVFTNGTLIDRGAVRLFSEYTPLGVEVSIYGAEARTHDSITGTQGSFEKAVSGVKLLKQAGIKVSIKTMLMTINEAEFQGICDLSVSLGVPFRMDAALFPKLSGDRAPVELRVEAARAVECEFSVPGRGDAWRKYLARMGEVGNDRSLYICGAGRTSFHVTSAGMLQPCLMTPHIAADLGKVPFAEGWRQVCGEITGLKAADDNPCPGCSNRILCDSCPGFFRLETGDENAESDYLCEIAECRAMAVKAFSSVQE